MEQRYQDNPEVRDKLEQYMSMTPCQHCHGARLKPESLAVLIGGLHISDVTAMSIERAVEFFDQLELTSMQMYIARQVIKEIKSTFQFLNQCWP